MMCGKNPEEHWLSCQLTFCPLGSETFLDEIEEALEIIRQSGLEYEIGVCPPLSRGRQPGAGPAGAHCRHHGPAGLPVLDAGHPLQPLRPAVSSCQIPKKDSGASAPGSFSFVECRLCAAFRQNHLNSCLYKNSALYADFTLILPAGCRNVQTADALFPAKSRFPDGSLV